MIPAALYLRVSDPTGERQTVDNQRPDLERLAAARGWDVVAVYEEHASAAKKRPAFGRMLLDARAGRFQVIGVWAIDRFGRSMHGNLADVRELDRVGVRLVSVQETWMDTTGPTRDLLLAIVSWVAEQERLRLIQRTRAGLERARKEGTRLGRPRVSPVALAAAAARVDGGSTITSAAIAERVGERTLRRYLASRETEST